MNFTSITNTLQTIPSILSQISTYLTHNLLITILLGVIILLFALKLLKYALIAIGITLILFAISSFFNIII